MTHVLLVKAAAGSTLEVLSDKPLWFEDKFSALAAVTVSFLLLGQSTKALVTAGTATGTVDVTGTIGDKFTIRTESKPSS